MTKAYSQFVHVYWIVKANNPFNAHIKKNGVMSSSPIPSRIKPSPIDISVFIEYPIYTIPSIVSKDFSNFFGGGFCMTIQIKRVLYDKTNQKGFVWQYKSKGFVWQNKKWLYDKTYNHFYFLLDCWTKFVFPIFQLPFREQSGFPVSCSKNLYRNIVRILLHLFHLE